MQTCRHELLDRTLVWNQRHLLHTLREYEQFYNSHRPHQGITNARPLRPLPSPIPSQDPDHPSQRPPTPTFGQHPQRVPPRRLTSTDDIFGKRTVHRRAGQTADRGEPDRRWPAH
ncbi:hypothetical protein [Kibdelosporangium banguiense]|uniref:hypothetical protein n=1 Tax=Kibdelosporangium banguiense TaxID=1365924 RepID=UPI0027DC2B71|nr:hypothetical protein [Kibdelosporangium banguiense]